MRLGGGGWGERGWTGEEGEGPSPSGTIVKPFFPSEEGGLSPGESPLSLQHRRTACPKPSPLPRPRVSPTAAPLLAPGTFVCLCRGLPDCPLRSLPHAQILLSYTHRRAPSQQPRRAPSQSLPAARLHNATLWCSRRHPQLFTPALNGASWGTQFSPSGAGGGRRRRTRGVRAGGPAGLRCAGQKWHLLPLSPCTGGCSEELRNISCLNCHLAPCLQISLEISGGGWWVSFGPASLQRNFTPLAPRGNASLKCCRGCHPLSAQIFVVGREERHHASHGGGKLARDTIKPPCVSWGLLQDLRAPALHSRVTCQLQKMPPSKHAQPTQPLSNSLSLSLMFAAKCVKALIQGLFGEVAEKCALVSMVISRFHDTVVLKGVEVPAQHGLNGEVDGLGPRKRRKLSDVF